MTQYCNEKPMAQGDVLIIPISCIPADAKKIDPVDGEFIVAHSETGHHHVIDVMERPSAEMYQAADDEFTAYIHSLGDGADLVHKRDFDTHETIHLASNKIFMIKRQREPTPEGWRMASD